MVGSTQIKTLKLLSGKNFPLLGQGTWGMGDDHTQRREEVSAIRYGIQLGMTLIDTAEIYADGKSEEIVGEAIHNQRKAIYLVSKVKPQHASRKGTIEACENSLKRLKTDYLDLYLLHWRGSVPLEETLEAFQILKQQGKIVDYGVSNFDKGDMEEAARLAGGKEIVVNQVLYNLMRRGIEWDLLPWCRERKIVIMAYSPIEQGRLLHHPILKTIADRHAATPSQIALAWLLQQEGVNVIPKASRLSHLEENRKALEIKLTKEDLNDLDEAFPPPPRKKPLEVI